MECQRPRAPVGKKKEPDPEQRIRLYCVGRLWAGHRVVCSVAKHPHDFLAGNLDQVAAAKGLDERGRLIHEGA
jgi:hypothetical protein